MKAKNFFKALALALSVSLLAPIANKVSADEVTIERPEIIGEASITMDINTGEVIYSKNADEKLSPASTTKLMTALLFAENKNKTDILTFSDTTLKVKETALNNYVDLSPGDTISAEDTMKSVLIFSANDTAYLMAESVAGTVANFVNMMNERAKELGLENTHFVNPSGLEVDPLNPTSTDMNQTTAYDLAKISIAAYKNDWIKDIISTKYKDTTINVNGYQMDLESRNKILGEYNNVGGKTGTETLAGHCFVGFFDKDGRELVTVVLKSEYGATGTNVFNDTKKVAEYSYSAEKEVYKNSGSEVGTVDLTYKTFIFFGPEKQITAPIYLTEDVLYYNNDFNNKYSSISYNGEIKNAWKLSTNKDVTLTYSTPGYSQDVSGKIQISVIDIIKANLPVYILSLLIVLIAVALIIVIIKIVNTRKRYKRRNRYY